MLSLNINPAHLRLHFSNSSNQTPRGNCTHSQLIHLTTSKESMSNSNRTGKLSPPQNYEADTL